MISVYLIFRSPLQSNEKFARLFCRILLLLIIRSLDDYKVGLTKKILLDISVMNSGEDAYDTRCFIQLPAGVEYVSSNSSSIVRKNETIMIE